MITGVRSGKVISAVGDQVTGTLPAARVGEGVCICTASGAKVPAVITRVERGRITVSAYAPLEHVAVGDPIESSPESMELELGTTLLGRVIDPSGSPMDRLGPVHGRRSPVVDPPIAASSRAPVAEPFWTGIRAIDGLLTIGRGARVGVFGAPAAGKSTLLEMLVHGAKADAIVVGLIGERGREAAAWIERIRPHTTIVCAPLDHSAAERMRGAHVAMAQGSQLRRRGLNVLVILDSLARFAMAARELAVANGESVGRGGFPPSVFNEMAKLLERGGNANGGSLTLLTTVLSDGADEREPLSDMARAALDGHIALSSELAHAGHYPAIDVLKSASRTMIQVVHPEHRAAAEIVRRAISRLQETKELRELGLMQNDPFLDVAVRLEDRINAFLRQRDPAGKPQETLRDLRAIAEALDVSAHAGAVN